MYQPNALELHLGHVALTFLGLVIVLQLRANAKKLKSLLDCANDLRSIHSETSKLAHDNAGKIFAILRAVEKGKL